MGPLGSIVLVRVGQTSAPDPASTRVDILHVLANGSPDRTFGARGEVSRVLAPQNIAEPVSALASDRKILLAGRSARGRLWLVRLTPDGNLDGGFGIDGRARPPAGAMEVGGLAVDGAGRALIAGERRPGSRKSRAGVIRFTAAGRLDKRWGKRGFAGVHFRPGTGRAVALRLGTRGTLYVGGTPDRRRFGVARLRTDNARTATVR
jgi:uncharacterized delta-60 repeat protein